jgi:hypothetical protein
MFPDSSSRMRCLLGCGIAVAGPYRYFGSVQQPRPECASWADLLLQAVTVHNPDVVVVLAGRWETVDRVHEGRWSHLGEPFFDDHPRDELDRAINTGAARPAGRVRLPPLSRGHFTWQADGIQLRSDGVHLTPEGVRWLFPWLLPQLEAAAS